MDGQSHTPRVNYDAIASDYHRRYSHWRYDGVERVLLHFLGNEPQAVLEVGCGTGHWLGLAQGWGHVAFGLDRSAEMLSRASAELRGTPLSLGTADRLPYRSASFDRVVCINAFHHFEQNQEFLREARRVLRPGGGLLIVGLDPQVGVDRWWVYDYFPSAEATDLARFPPSERIRGWLAEAGFESIATTEAEHFDRSVPAREALDQGLLDKNQSSQLALLSDDEYGRGIARMRQGIEAAARRGEELRIVSDLRLYATVGRLGQDG